MPAGTTAGGGGDPHPQATAPPARTGDGQQRSFRFFAGQ
jgi:hypothetical protein